MSWADLEKLAIGKPRPDGGATLVVRDDRALTAISEVRLVSLLVAISRVARAHHVLAERHAGRGRVVYTTSGAPPGFLVEAVSAAGGVVFDGAREHAQPAPPAATLLLDAAFCDLAIAARRRMNVRTFGEALDVREYELRRKPVARTDHAAWWTAVFELTALAGELLRAERPGKWSIVASQRVPLGLDLGKGEIAFPSKLAEAVAAGEASSLRTLVANANPPPIAAHVRAPASPPVVATSRPPTSPMAVSLDDAPRRITIDHEVRLMPLLHDRRRLPSEDVLSELLVADEVDNPELPIVCFVDDRDDAILWPGAGTLLPAARAKAIANLATEPLEVTTLDLPGVPLPLALVTGSFFAAEAILHRPTMQGVEARLAQEVLLVGVPARGQLIAAGAVMPDDMLQAFLMLVEKRHLDAPEADRISSEVLVYQGKAIGRVQSNLMDTRRALRRMGIDPDA